MFLNINEIDSLVVKSLESRLPDVSAIVNGDEYNREPIMRTNNFMKIQQNSFLGMYIGDQRNLLDEKPETDYLVTLFL